MDHPRACGANKYTSSAFSPVPGSSPRVRGKRVPGTRPPVFVRSIPAHAGQTVSPRIQTTCPSDHPRACGANIEHLERQQRKYGSSPRVRGKLFLPFFACAGIRIIPARAGQTARRSTRRRTSPDHPRACGANQEVLVLRASFLGSSPRVRGKHDCQTSRRSGYRIIPARAGQTRRGVRVSSTSPDHPRACGANSCSLSRLSSTSGSSPRVRGKPWRAVCLHGRYRIIPARAGQTSAG